MLVSAQIGGQRINSRRLAPFGHMTMPLFWLVYRYSNEVFVIIEPGASIIHARLRSAIDGLDEGEFTEGHELDRKMRVSSNARPS